MRFLQMSNFLLHIYNNTPLGKETLLQSIYFCKTLNLSLSIYIPTAKRIFIPCGNKNKPISINLDKSYFYSPESAIIHVKEITKNEGIIPHWVIPQNDRERNCPIILTRYGFMCCPRCIKEPLSKLGVGFIDFSVRTIINRLQYPVLIPSSVFKPWERIAVFYGGSHSSLKVLELGLQICRASGLKMDIFTQLERGETKNSINAETYKIFKKEMDREVNEWHWFNGGDFTSNIFNVSHDSLVILGGFHSPKYRKFSSKMEKIQSVLPNSLLAVGPKITSFKPKERNMPDRTNCFIDSTKDVENSYKA
jgi:hypothetical protein